MLRKYWYIIRNQITSRTTNPLNYEQLDVTRSTIVGHQRYYYGAGYNISPFAEREKWAFQLGYFASRPWSGHRGVNTIYGADVKIFEQNRYHPNVKVGLGLELWSGRTNPPRIILEYYYGYLPYSRLEYRFVQLMGVGVYFNTRI